MIVALLTDFGTRDHYVGTMKAVVLSVCPEATLVDITHHIPPQDVLTGALELAAAYSYFPPATVFLGVVDPGVGSARRAIAASAGGYSFVGPDNGLLSLAWANAAPPGPIVELTEKKFMRSTISKTFEGRDRFAPAAGWLARGAPLTAFGRSITDPVRLTVPAPHVVGAAIEGEVLLVDRFGNLITNIRDSTLRELARPTRVAIAGRVIPSVVETYAEAPTGALCALIGSSGYLELAINGGNAAAVLAVMRGEPVVVTAGAGLGQEA